MSLHRRLLGFSTLPIASAIIPLLALPLVARASTAEEWAAMMAGQAIGAYASTIGYVGWNLLGIPAVAQSRTENERRELYARSFFTRLVAICALAIPTSAVAALVAPEGARINGVIFALSSLMTALGVAWYAVGVSSPRIVAIYELGPRLGLTVIAAALVVSTGEPDFYAIALLAAPIVGVSAFHLRAFGHFLPPFAGWRSIATDVKSRSHGWLVEISGNLYASAPVPVSAVVAPVDDAASYASSDKIYRYGLLTVIAVGNGLQGWVLEVEDSNRRRRNIVAIAIMLALGIVGLLVLWLAGTWLTVLLFGPSLAGTQQTMLWLGIAFFAVSASTPLLRNVLLPARRERLVLGITVSGAVIGLASMVALAYSVGASGVAIGLAISELFTLVACALATLRVGLGCSPGRI